MVLLVQGDNLWRNKGEDEMTRSNSTVNVWSDAKIDLVKRCM